MLDDHISQLLKRANELEDIAQATTEPKTREQLVTLADAYRRMAALEIRILGELPRASRE
jgi:hypothetical protein